MAFSIKAVFGVDTTGVKTELRQLRREFNSFAGDVAKLGLAGAAGVFVALSKGALDLASSLKDTALQVGINVESLQALHYAATQNGSSVEAMNKSLEKLRLNVREAVSGNKEYAQALATLGLTTSALIRQPLEKQYELVAKAVKNTADKTAAYNAVSQLFGTKIGPDQMQVLTALARDGFPATAKAAAAAGQVMKAETIAALESAQQAIENFKKQATVAVGKILVNFRSEEGLKLMGLQLLRAAASFGGRILDAIAQANDIMGAVFKGTFTGVGNWFRDKLVDAIQVAAAALNARLPSLFQIDLSAFDKLRSTGEYVSASITRAIAETKPTTFQKDFTAFWDQAVSEQQKVVDDLNRVDMKKPAAELRDAGRALTDSGARIAEEVKPVVDAWKLAIDKMIAATKEMGGIIAGIRGGSVFNDLSPEALAEVVRQNRAAADRLRNPALDTNYFSPTADGTTVNLGAAFEAGRLEAEAMNAQRLLDQINRFQGDVGRLGVDGARRNWDPVVFETLLRRFGPGSQDIQNQQLNELRDLKKLFNRGITLVDDTTT
jgi:hypothetical protein